MMRMPPGAPSRPLEDAAYVMIRALSPRSSTDRGAKRYLARQMSRARGFALRLRAQATKADAPQVRAPRASPASASIRIGAGSAPIQAPAAHAKLPDASTR